MNRTAPYAHLVAGNELHIPLRNGQYVRAINFDNGATTPPFFEVLQEVQDLALWYGPIHRGGGYKSIWSSNYYEHARQTVFNFVQADPNFHSVIYVKNTTEGINKAAWLVSKQRPNSIVLSTEMEHHSNDLPWRSHCTVKHVEIDEQGRLSLADLEKKLCTYRGQVSLVAVTGASNVTGYKNPLSEIAVLAHRYGAEILVDGAQLVPHAPVSMVGTSPEERLDYLVFSAHKMYAPFGVGVLIGPQKTMDYFPPHMPGGGTVELVTPDQVIWKALPHREEAGTPNFIGVGALHAAIRCLNQIGLPQLQAYEQGLTQYALSQLQAMPGIQLYGQARSSEDVSIISFNLVYLHHSLASKILSMEFGISLRSGCFCAQPYIQKLLGITEETIQDRIRNPHLPMPGMLRASFGCYNTYDEVDYFIQCLRQLLDHLETYEELYHHFPLECHSYF